MNLTEIISVNFRHAAVAEPACLTDILSIRQQQQAGALPAENHSRHLSPDDGTGLRADQVPWLSIARRIMAGEFGGAAANSSIIESLAIGLRRVPHPLCKEAFKRLRQNKAKSLDTEVDKDAGEQAEQGALLFTAGVVSGDVPEQ